MVWGKRDREKLDNRFQSTDRISKLSVPQCCRATWSTVMHYLPYVEEEERSWMEAGQLPGLVS